MKKIILLILILGLGGVLYALVRAFPYVAYNKALSSGIDNSFLSLDAPRDEEINTSEYQIVKMAGLYGEDKSYWREFHFRHFLIPMPVHHPIYLFFPMIEIDQKSGTPMFGVKITDFKEQEVFSFKVREISDFKWDLNDTKLFSLALYKNYIQSKSQKDIWQDMFLKNVVIDRFNWSNPVMIFKRWMTIQYEELVYNAFLLKLRREILPSESREINFYSSKFAGVIEVIDDESKSGRVKNYRQERMYFLDNGKVFTFEFRTRLDSIEAEALRQKYLREISFKYTVESSSTELYNKFRALPYEKKIDQEGLVYLFSAWSHHPDRKSFLREMIQFMERGRKNNIHLDPLYEYARLIFGSNFSSFEDTIDETAEEKIKRLRKEELEKELKAAEQTGPEQSYDKFESPEQRMQYLLQKAKDSGDDTDKKEKKIFVD